MSQSAMPPSSGDEERLDDALARERLETDPQQEPNAPNREPTVEPVRHDLRDDSNLDEASDDDELDKPDAPTT